MTRYNLQYDVLYLKHCNIIYTEYNMIQSEMIYIYIIQYNLSLRAFFKLLPGQKTIFEGFHPGRLTWNMSSWRFGSDDFPFQLGDGCRFQPFIFQGKNHFWSPVSSRRCWQGIAQPPPYDFPDAPFISLGEETRRFSQKRDVFLTSVKQWILQLIYRYYIIMYIYIRQ